MDFMKKLWAFISGVPALAAVATKMFSTGKIEPVEALNALTAFSPDFKKVADVTNRTTSQGGGVADVIKNCKDMGEITILGQKINPATLSHDLRKGGGMGTFLADVIDGLQNMSTEEIEQFGEQASNLNSWRK